MACLGARVCASIHIGLMEYVALFPFSHRPRLHAHYWPTIGLGRHTLQCYLGKVGSGVAQQFLGDAHSTDATPLNFGLSPWPFNPGRFEFRANKGSINIDLCGLTGWRKNVGLSCVISNKLFCCTFE